MGNKQATTASKDLSKLLPRVRERFKLTQAQVAEKKRNAWSILCGNRAGKS